MGVISTTIMSAIHYNTFDHLHYYWNFILYPAGIIILLLGIFILGCNNNDNTSNNEHDNDNIIEVIYSQEKHQNVSIGLRKQEATMYSLSSLFSHDQKSNVDNDITRPLMLQV